LISISTVIHNICILYWQGLDGCQRNIVDVGLGDGGLWGEPDET
jgi:hypothetical protein